MHSYFRHQTNSSIRYQKRSLPHSGLPAVDTTGDTITETTTGGIDTVMSSLSYTLGATSNLENLTLTGTSNLTGTGNSLNNAIAGNSGANTLTDNVGNDTLNGGLGIDTLIGGHGNDTYVVDSTGDTITETTTGGIDTVQSSVGYTLGDNLEKLLLTGTSAVNGTGNSLNNAIAGNSGANTLDSGAGNDALSGGAGNDTLSGGAGNDVLIGGLGNDSLTGGALSDRFTFNLPNEGTDTITDFVVAQDKIYVSAAGFSSGLVANATITTAQFLSSSTATAATDSNQRFIYNTSSGALFFDADGNGALSSAVQIATLTTKPIITNADIFVST